MKTKLGQMLLSILPVAFVITLQAADDVPQRPDFTRYNTMLQRSPFAVATAVVAPAATPNFAKDLYVANAAHTEQADLVTVISASDKMLREYLTTEKPNDHGYSIANIQWSDKPGETKVTISKDGQFATLGFNQSLLNQSSPTANVAAPGLVPAPTPFPTPIQPQMRPQYPTVATPVPHTRPVIQRNPQSAAGPIPPPVPNGPPAED
jgi:hypothetical protein